MPDWSFCVHAHFYQPPREDPLTGIIPPEPGASPYSNWNERIHAECYRPNALAGNFQRISYNIGPTLYAWMSSYDPETCRMIVSQDRANLERHGVGNAMAQAYNHTILPLASLHDKQTQVAWGIADFEHRYGRKPQGMWLPETAVDLETLTVLRAQGIEFTILAPWQADEAELDPTEPYRVTLPDGDSIVVFFYHRDLSGGISFNPGMTINADNFARFDLLPHFQAEKTRRGEPQLLLLATDGELYGHHQPHRDRFLARLVDGASSHLGLNQVYPALWLKKHPPRRSIKILDKTSWSCHHGVGRWSGDCGCTPGGGTWKAQLRYALERLAASLDCLYVDAVRPFIAQPWELRSRYIHVILGQVQLEDLLFEMAGRRLPSDVVQRLRLLLEAQTERQKMFTSCGWFFDDFDRIEPKNNVAYAAQAVRLANLATGVDLGPQTAHNLQRVHSSSTRLRADQVFWKQLRRTPSDRRLLST